MAHEALTPSHNRVRQLAVEANVDPRTIVRVLRGEEVKGNAGDRARAACVKAGLLEEGNQ